MPELSRFKGIIIRMYYDDVSQHYKPHVHVFYGGEEAVVALDGEVLAGRLPSNQYRMLNGWLALHEEEVYRAWNLAVAMKPFEKIDRTARLGFGECHVCFQRLRLRQSAHSPFGR